MNLLLRLLSLLAIVLLPAASALAAPLSIAELLELDVTLECRATCEHGKVALYETCVAACPVVGAEWDKDRDGDLDGRDHTLAYLEYWDGGALTSMCYEDEAVVPIAACGLAECRAAHSELDCQDLDNDGLRFFKEKLLGTSDTSANLACGANTDCTGFGEACSFLPEVNRALCRARSCTGACTAFHLESVASDNDELIVRVHYDYSPTPATVLDLRLEYDAGALKLVDSRPLAALTSRGKTVQTRHTGNGKLRLIVLSAASSREIPNEAIIELVFSRITGSQAKVAFSRNDFEQEWSMAPDPGLDKPALRNDALWGTAVAVGPRDENGPRLVLHYSFDSSVYTNVVSAQKLADWSFVCANPNACTAQETADKLVRKTRAESLQLGVTSVGPSIAGVYGMAGTLDGAAEHLELPISVNGSAPPFQSNTQSFSISLWAYREPNVARASALHGDMIFSHNHGVSELTRFGLLAVPRGTGSFDLVWFEGDLGSATLSKTVIKEGLLDRRWTQVGLSVDAATRVARVYVDGEPQAGELEIATAPAIQCPQIDSSGNLHLAQQGSFDGGRAPEQLTFSSSANNLLGIERMEPRGLDRQKVLRPPSSAATDPDYSPVVDRIVYAASASNDFEIWVARADGTEAVQVTDGFGDTARGIFARRPRWAPDGSAIVFESNVYDVGSGDNSYARSYQLYYLAFDPIAKNVVIPLADGGTAQKLVYGTLVSTQTVLDYRLSKGADNHTQVEWLRKPFSDQGQSYLGELIFNTSDRRFEGKQVKRLRIATPISGSVTQPVTTFATIEPGAAVSLLAADRQSTASGVVTERLFLQKEWVSYEPAADLAVQMVSGSGDEIAVVTYVGTQTDARCYDLNRNNACDGATEDRNADGVCNQADCTPSELRDLFLAYDKDVLAPTFNADGGVLVTPGSWVAQADKQVRVADVHTSQSDLIKVELASPLNDVPIPIGTELARIPLRRNAAGNGGLSLLTRRVRQELYVKTNGAEPTPFVMQQSELERVLEATFSPDGSRLALAGIQGARPVLVTTENLVGTSGLAKASIVPMRVQGLDWERVERLFPCNWVGAFRNPYSGFYVSAFRGALDEVRVHSYARPAVAFLSEAERGRERLAAEGRDGVLVASTESCSTDLDCPPYQLCGADNRCTTQACDPQDRYSCERGLCNLQPVPVSLDTTQARWVCSVDCNTDSQCFQQECLNGPCRFCAETTDSCIECRQGVQNVGGLTIAGIEGCPDRNSFSCDQGSCVSECYSIENGQSKYLCDEATEYCRQGRCVLFDWSWSDLSPATFAGLGETSFDREGLVYTTAISQLYSIELEAYGVEDYGHPPEVLVQGRVSTADAQAYGDAWFDLGRVLIYNKTRSEAGLNKYVMFASQPVTHLRLQLVTPPYENLNGASTGLRARDQAFCGAASWSEVDRSACFRRASGSRASVGYPVSIPAWEARKACRDNDRSDCPPFDSREADPQQAYLKGGQPTVIVHSLKLRGESLLGAFIERNTVCSYEGGIEPLDGDRPRKLFFGDVALEQSRQRDRYFSDHPATALIDARQRSGGAWALLNCNYANPHNPLDVAELVVQAPPNLYPTPGAGTASEGLIAESANGCFVTLQNGTREPCREWIGADVSIDPFGEDRQLHRTLDYHEFTSFGYDADE